jgi:hypothetical protein
MSETQGQDPQPSPDLPQRRATYLALIGIFAGLYAAFSAREHKQGQELDIGAKDLALLGLATFRTGRVIAFDAVTEPLRAPVTEERDGGVQPKGSGVQRVFGELLSCPTCIGTWIAAGSVYGLRVAPRPTRTFLAFMAAGGVAEVLDYATQALDKAGRAAEARTKQVSEGSG